jgi:hypothetical protein
VQVNNNFLSVGNENKEINVNMLSVSFFFHSEVTFDGSPLKLFYWNVLMLGIRIF